MDSESDSTSVDPDYVSNNTAIRLKELRGEEDINGIAEKVKTIIEEEFDKELSERQEQIEQIEEEICKAQKLLHLLRYVIITSYYNKEGTKNDTESSAGSSASSFEGQNRIHPALKKLIGGNTNLEFLNPLRKRKGKRKEPNTFSYEDQAGTSSEPDTKKIKSENIEEATTSSEDQYSKFSSKKCDDASSNINRTKTKHRIVVGNISKWMPSLENDNLTHKWMVYVRGPKEAPDVAHIINKTVFYLHPSYRPHDVVEVSDPPFHLARRGWGEFPVRVQIYFKNTLNKPIDIIHNLKLDKTYTGRQTLGNETIVDLFLHDDNLIPAKKESPISTKKCDTEELLEPNIEFNISYDEIEKELSEIKQECDENFLSRNIKTELKDDLSNFGSINSTDVMMKTEPEDDESNFGSTSLEHDYCFGDKKEIEKTQNINDSQTVLFEHSYTLPFSDEGLKEKQIEDTVIESQDTNLIYGLDDSYNQNLSDSQQLLNAIIRQQKSNHMKPIFILPQSFSKLLLNNGNIVSIKFKPNEPTLTKLETPVINYDEFRIALPKNKFKCIGEALPYIFKKLPLYHELGRILNYKCLYPFTANSLEEYSMFHLEKRLSCEWSRAKTVKNLLISEKINGSQNWNTKAVLMYGRSHSYTPLATYSIFRRKSSERALLKTCFCPEPTKQIPPVKVHTDKESDISVDIESGSETLELKTKNGRKKYIDISDNNLKPHCSFIKHTALDCGIVLKPEEIDDGIILNGAERMILEAVKCLADNLIRRGRNHLICRDNKFNEDTSEIEVGDIQVALSERSELKALYEFQKKRQQMEFYL